MTPVHLERCDGAANMARSYAASVAPTLFRAWAVVREWGRIGAPGTVRGRTGFPPETPRSRVPRH